MSALIMRSVYVFHRTSRGTWVREVKLTAADGETADSFGQSVGLSGNTLVVGAWHHDHEAGAAYAFQRSPRGQWSQAAELASREEAAGDHFGMAVAGRRTLNPVAWPTSPCPGHIEQSVLAPAPSGSGFGYSVAALGQLVMPADPADRITPVTSAPPTP